MAKVNDYPIVFINALLSGFFGGMLLALLYLLLHYFNMTKVNHRTILNFFHIKGSWLEIWYGYIFFVLFIGIVSIVVALIYYILLRKLAGWIPGAIFGLFIWLMIGLFIPWKWYDVTLASFFKTHSNVLNICSLLLYGIFIGYSISYDEEMSKHSIQNDE